MTTTLPALRTWRHGDTEPKDCKQVRDKDGDVWTREHTGWSMGDTPVGWHFLCVNWGPITEVDTPERVDHPVQEAQLRELAAFLENQAHTGGFASDGSRAALDAGAHVLLDTASRIVRLIEKGTFQ